MNFLNCLLSCLICLYIILLPLIPSKFLIGNIPFNGDIILIVILFIYILAFILNSDTRKRCFKGIKDFFTDKFSIFTFVWILMMFISIIYAKDKKLAFGESIRFLSYIVLFFIIKYEITSKKILNNILRSVTVSVILVDIIGIFEYVKNLGSIQTEGQQVFLRIASTLENSNNLGAFCILVIFPYIVLCLKEKNRKKKIFYFIISLLTLINIILSFSRNAWIGIIIGFVTLIFIYNIKLIWVLIIGGAVSLTIPKIRIRLKDIGNFSQNLSRVTLWQVAGLMIKDHFLLGVGAGNYRSYYDEYINKVKYLGYGAYDKFHPHNIYIKSQCELGVIGLISLLAYLIMNLININKFSNNVKDIYYKCFYKGFTASLVSFVVMNFIDNFFSAPKVISFFWILIAVANSYKYNLYEG